MKKKIFALLAASMVLLLMVAGCKSNRFVYLEGERPGDGSEKVVKKKPKDLKIGLSISTLNNPFFMSVRNGAEQTAKKAGAKITVSDARNDSSKQADDISDFIQQNVDVILVNPVDSHAIATSVKAANAAGIPVIALDRTSDGGKLLTLVASDNVKGGKMAAEYLISKIGKGAKVAELEGIPGASATNERGKGFEDIAKKELDIVASQTAKFDRAKGLTVMENILQSHPNIKGVFCQNDEMALGAVEAISNANKLNDITIVGFDGTPDAFKSIKQGRLDATVAQQPKKIGELATKAAFDHFEGKHVPSKIPSPLKLVTKDNV